MKASDRVAWTVSLSYAPPSRLFQPSCAIFAPRSCLHSAVEAARHVLYALPLPLAKTK